MKRKKILIVDDSTTALMLERVLLSRGPWELVTASDGPEACEVASVEHPDLILMDVVMPRMDGFEACRKLRETEETRSIPIILVTTRGEAEHVEQGFVSGCSDYVTKPIDRAELLSKVRNHLGE